MLSTLEALLLGIVQGITEFLPISSSGHLVLAQHFVKLTKGSLLFDVIVHLATFCATIVILRKEVWGLLRALPRIPRFLKALFQKGHLAIGDDPEAWTIILIAFSTLVTGTIGLLFHDLIRKLFSSIAILPFTFLATGLMLFSIPKEEKKKGKTPSHATLKDALWIGLAQAFAILPGISRSGATIATGLFCGFKRRFAGEYAFLVSLPSILGAVILESREGLAHASFDFDTLAVGFLAAFLIGAGSLALLLRWVQAGKLRAFAYYCWVLAGLAAVLRFLA